MEARATLALKPGVWFRRGRLLIVSPDSLGTACPLSGRNSTYRLVQILEAGSHVTSNRKAIMGTSASAPMLRWFQFWVVEDVITRSRTASGHVDGAADDASTAKIDGWRGRGYAR